MVSDSSVIPFFPKYDAEYKADEKILVIWFEPHFSQSHYNIKNCTSGSNACTLIAIVMASKCNAFKIAINHPQKSINIQLIHLFALSMLEGNKIHENLKTKNLLRHINLNVPEAMKFAGKLASGLVEWKSLVYMESLSKSLYENLIKTYKEWIKAKKKSINNLYVVLVADSRTVLFIIQNETDTITIVDSHQHSPCKGAFIAITRINRIIDICQWFCNVQQRFYKTDPKLYELSYLYFKKLTKTKQ